MKPEKVPEGCAEEWRPLLIDNEYEASNLGRIRSFAKELFSKHSTPRIIALTPFYDNGKLKRMCVCIRQKTGFPVGRLIYEAFNGAIPEGQMIDHIDRDPTNNALTNLRLASNRENSFNQGASRSNKSGYKGVYQPKKSKSWLATIKVNGKSSHLGSFSTKEEAAHAYDRAAIEHFGERAYLNFPEIRKPNGQVWKREG